MKSSNKRIVCFGEVLWDILPSGAVPGGAPMNVAIRASSLGMPSAVISKVGIDAYGQSLLELLNLKNVDTSGITTDATLPTGVVNVSLDSDGIATYNIKFPSAWDEIVFEDKTLEMIKHSQAFVFGSLACRNHTSRNTLLSLLDVAPYKVFDINIRPGFFDAILFRELMQRANLVKLNEDELHTLARAFGSNRNEIDLNILYLHEQLGLNTICVTCGAKGAILWMNNTFYKHSGFTVKVADTVGAGDSFLAALLYQLLSKKGGAEALEYACAVGAIVASKTGANPDITDDEINSLLFIDTDNN